jgi:hypothetical protein
MERKESLCRYQARLSALAEILCLAGFSLVKDKVWKSDLLSVLLKP